MISTPDPVASVIAIIKSRLKNDPSYSFADALAENKGGWHGTIEVTSLGTGAANSKHVDIDPLPEAELRVRYDAAVQELSKP